MARKLSSNEVIVQLKVVPSIPKPVQTEGIVIDELLESEVGSLGIWQWSIVLLGIFSTSAASNFPVFADTEPMKRCRLDNTSEHLVTQMNWNFTYIRAVTGGGTELDRNQGLDIGCRMFVDWRNHLNATKNGQSTVNLSRNTMPCDSNGYVYEYLDFQYKGGIVENFNLVCGRHLMIPVGTSIFMVSMVVGYVSGGFWGARFGIRNALIYYSFVELIASALCSLVPELWLYTVLRVLVGIGSYGKLSAFNLIIHDITIPRYRSIVNATYLLGFNVTSRAFLVLFAWLLSDWRWMSLAATSHCVLVFAYFFLIPESPRWLLANARQLDALNVLERGKKMNSLFRAREKSESDKLSRLKKQETRRPSIISISLKDVDTKLHRVVPIENSGGARLFTKLFASTYLIKTLVLTVVLSMGFAFIFLGTSLYTRMIKLSIFVVSLMVAAAGIPGVIIALLAYRFVRHRRIPLVIAYLIVATVLLAGGTYTYIVQPSRDFVLSASIILTVMLMVTVQCMLFIYFPELYPSEVRAQGFGMTAGLGRFGSAMATFVNHLELTHKHGLPVIIYGVVALSSGLLALCLSDTTGAELEVRKTICNEMETQNSDWENDEAQEWKTQF